MESCCADFVTAMMAFFMVMWLVAQNKPVREAVSSYFSDPYGKAGKPAGSLKPQFRKELHQGGKNSAARKSSGGGVTPNAPIEDSNDQKMAKREGTSMVNRRL